MVPEARRRRWCQRSKTVWLLRRATPCVRATLGLRGNPRGQPGVKAVRRKAPVTARYLQVSGHIIAELVIGRGFVDHRRTNVASVCVLTYRMHRRVTLTQFFAIVVVGPGERVEPSIIFAWDVAWKRSRWRGCTSFARSSPQQWTWVVFSRCGTFARHTPEGTSAHSCTIQDVHTRSCSPRRCTDHHQAGTHPTQSSSTPQGHRAGRPSTADEQREKNPEPTRAAPQESRGQICLGDEIDIYETDLAESMAIWGFGEEDEVFQ